MKKKVLLFVLASVSYAILLLMMGYDMGREKVERREHILRLSRLSMTVTFWDSVRAGDVATDGNAFRQMVYLHAGGLFNRDWGHDSLIVPLAQKLLEIGETIPAAEKSVGEQKWEDRLKKKVQEKVKHIECLPDTLEHPGTKQITESELTIP